MKLTLLTLENHFFRDRKSDSGFNVCGTVGPPYWKLSIL